MQMSRRIRISKNMFLRRMAKSYKNLGRRCWWPRRWWAPVTVVWYVSMEKYAASQKTDPGDTLTHSAENLPGKEIGLCPKALWDLKTISLQTETRKWLSGSVGTESDSPASVWIHALSFHSLSEAICSNSGQEDDGTSLSSSLQPLMSTLGFLYESPAEARPFCWINISISVNKNKLAGQQSGLPARVCLPTD